MSDFALFSPDPAKARKIDEADVWSAQAGVYVTRPDPHQLKSGKVNFWPTTGRIHIDGEGKVTLRGLEGIAQLLAQRPSAFAMRGGTTVAPEAPAYPRPDRKNGTKRYDPSR